MKVDIAREKIHETWRAGWGGSSVLGERSAVTREALGRGGINQLVSYINYDYHIIITNIIRIKVQIILY